MVEKVEYSVQLFYFFWYFEAGVYMNDFKTKAINGIGDNLLKILSVNLTYDSYNVIKDITKENNDKKENYSQLVAGFNENCYVYFDDLEDFMKFTNRDYLRSYFHNSNQKIELCFRRLFQGAYIWVKLEISKDEDYSSSNELVTICIININRAFNLINGKIQQLEEKIQFQKKENEILKSLASIYYSMHLIDLEKDSLSEISSQWLVREYVNHIDGASSQMNSAMTHLIAKDYQKKALEFADLKTVRERLGLKKIISEELLGNNVGWIRASFIPVEYNEIGVVRVLFLVQVIDEEKRREERLISISNTDQLTSLYNRRAYEAELTKVDANKNGNLCFVVYDVNGLKRMNDTLGHAAGDELIRVTASIISDVFSEVGKCFRTGGDEFVVIAITNEVELLINKTQELFKNCKGEYIDGISVSAGYAKRDDYPDINAFELEKVADKCMYENKKIYYVENNID